tara:strand:- start:4663 stop:4854 length:192 start_codon:yes stop_codon:yes gene_type:complete
MQNFSNSQVKAFHSYWVYYKEDTKSKEMLVEDIFGRDEWADLLERFKGTENQIYLVIEWGSFP